MLLSKDYNECDHANSWLWFQVHLIKSEEYYKSTAQTLDHLFSFLNISTAVTDDLVHAKGGKSYNSNESNDINV